MDGPAWNAGRCPCRSGKGLLLRTRRQDRCPSSRRPADHPDRRSSAMSEDDILSRYLTRRQLLRLAAATGATAAVGAFLAACGSAATTPAPPASVAPASVAPVPSAPAVSIA